MTSVDPCVADSSGYSFNLQTLYASSPFFFAFQVIVFDHFTNPTTKKQKLKQITDVILVVLHRLLLSLEKSKFKKEKFNGGTSMYINICEMKGAEEKSIFLFQVINQTD